MIEIVLDDDTLNRLGSGSLVGIAMGKDAVPVGPGTKVRLLFPQTDLAWRAKHGGPDTLLLSENAPLCLAEGIIDLLLLGATVEVVSVPWPSGYQGAEWTVRLDEGCR